MSREVDISEMRGLQGHFYETEQLQAGEIIEKAANEIESLRTELQAEREKVGELEKAIGNGLVICRGDLYCYFCSRVQSDVSSSQHLDNCIVATTQRRREND